MDTQLIYKIALSKAKGVGPVLCKNIATYFLGDIEAIFKEKAKTLAKIPGINLRVANAIADTSLLSKADEELAFITKHNIKTAFLLDANYPARLKRCEDAPIIMYSLGNHGLSDKKVLAIVGTRKVTERGKDICKNLIRNLAQQYSNVTIVSGLAYGVDICAHRAALDFGLQTIAVLAHGLDRIYPNVHKRTANEILNSGALLTEFQSGTNPDRQNFVRRNRIVAGLADATVVIESAAKGGALITAGIAQSYNRDVLAFPGRIDDEFSKGCNLIIKSNIAAMIESAEDLAYALNWEKESGVIKQLNLFKQPQGDEGVLYDLLMQGNEMSVNALSTHSGITISKVSSLLLKMEFDGLVKSLPGNMYRWSS